MRIYLKNNPARFYPNPVRNDGDLGCFEQRHPNKNNNQMSSDMGPVADTDVKTFFYVF